jgi:hypothetical protein
MPSFAFFEFCTITDPACVAVGARHTPRQARFSVEQPIRAAKTTIVTRRITIPSLTRARRVWYQVQAVSIVRASLPALLAAVLTMASLAIGVRWPAPDFSGPIGDGSGYARTRAWFRTTGFQDPSYDAATGRQFSWTAARARIIVPEIDRSRAYRMTLRIAAARSAEMPPPPTIAVSVDGAPALAAQTTNDAADYTVDIPAGQARRLIVAIDAGNTFVTPPPDQRTLGVVVENIRLQPVDATFALTWTTLLLAGVASMTMVAALSLCGFGPVWALVCAGVVTVVNVGLLRLDGAFLISRRWPTGLRMEVEFGGQLQQRPMPDRLRLRVATSGDRLHVVEYEHPGHKPQRVEARHQPAEQRLLAHVVGEDHPRPAAVFQPTGQKVARHGLLLGERKVPNLTPVNLQVFAGQALEPNRHVADGLFVQQTQPLAAHRCPPH